MTQRDSGARVGSSMRASTAEMRASMGGAGAGARSTGSLGRSSIAGSAAGVACSPVFVLGRKNHTATAAAASTAIKPATMREDPLTRGTLRTNEPRTRGAA